MIYARTRLKFDIISGFKTVFLYYFYFNLSKDKLLKINLSKDKKNDFYMTTKQKFSLILLPTLDRDEIRVPHACSFGFVCAPAAFSYDNRFCMPI